MSYVKRKSAEKHKRMEKQGLELIYKRLMKLL